MPLALAQALFNGATVEEFDALGDSRSLFGLGLWALQFSPQVALDPLLSEELNRGTPRTPPVFANGLVLNLSGTDRLHRSEDLLLEKIDHALKKNGYRARYAITRSPSASWALSRFASERSVIIPQNGALIEALAPLPLEALRIYPETAAALREIGLTTVRDVFKLPRRPLVERFGLPLLKRLDQMLGAVHEPLTWISAQKSYAISKRFAAPLCESSAVKEALKKLFIKLHQQLQEDGKVSRHFVVQLKPLSGRGPSRSISSISAPPLIRKELMLNSALNDSAKITQIIEPFLDSLQLGGNTVLNGIDECSLLALSPRPAGQDQCQLPSLESRSDPLSRAEFEHILNQYAARFGAEKIKHAALHQHHQPEKSFRFQPIERNGASIKAVKRPETLHKKDFPSHIFSRPEEVAVMALLPDYAPAIIHWRKKKLKITRSVAPEKIHMAWWNNAAPASPRTYFKIQEEHGRWLWLFREEKTMRWFVHGIWT